MTQQQSGGSNVGPGTVPHTLANFLKLELMIRGYQRSHHISVLIVIHIQTMCQNIRHEPFRSSIVAEKPRDTLDYAIVF